MSTLDWKLLRSVALAGVFTGLSGLTALVPVSAAAQSAVVRGLPDFTELVELAGPRWSISAPPKKPQPALGLERWTKRWRNSSSASVCLFPTRRASSAPAR